MHTNEEHLHRQHPLEGVLRKLMASSSWRLPVSGIE